MKSNLRRSHWILRTAIALLVLLVVAAVLAQTSFAQQFVQFIAGDPDEGSLPYGQTTIPIEGSQPDADGYTGAIPQNAEIASLAGSNPDGSPGLFQGAVVNAPDTDNYQGDMPAPAVQAPAAEGNPDGEPAEAAPEFFIDPNAEDNSIEAVDAWSGFYYVFSAGSSLHSADFSMRQVYNPGSCASVIDTGSEFITLNLDLPDGAKIDYLRIFYYDTNASNSSATLRKYDGAGGTTVISTIASAGNTGYGTMLSPYSGHIIDNVDGGYVLNWLPSVTGTTMRLCGLRVAYRLPLQ